MGVHLKHQTPTDTQWISRNRMTTVQQSTFTGDNIPHSAATSQGTGTLPIATGCGDKGYVRQKDCSPLIIPMGITYCFSEERLLSTIVRRLPLPPIDATLDAMKGVC